VAFAIYIIKKKVSYYKRRIMKTQIFHHAKIQTSKKSSKIKKPKSQVATQAKIPSFKNPSYKNK
jgi:hypothetical protein